MDSAPRKFTKRACSLECAEFYKFDGINLGVKPFLLAGLVKRSAGIYDRSSVKILTQGDIKK